LNRPRSKGEISSPFRVIAPAGLGLACSIVHEESDAGNPFSQKKLPASPSTRRMDFDHLLAILSEIEILGYGIEHCIY